jgi:hypothetical protein
VTVPSSFVNGWRPPTTSMMLSRAAAMVNPSPETMNSSSGPRWRMVASILPTASRSLRPSTPQMPHIYL